MKVNITSNASTKEIKDLFEKTYPDLKIEFFTKNHSSGEGSPKSEMIQGNVPLNTINNHLPDGMFEINEMMRVDEVEHEFESKFGLHVQVFRLSRNVWLETTNSDKLTLKEQMQKAKDFNSVI